MSKTITWIPAPIKYGRELSIDLLRPIMSRHEVNEVLKTSIFLTEADLPFFEGMVFGNIKDADFIVDKIKTHGRIEIVVIENDTDN
ncbi:MAG TPA: hypothetical protein VIQ00_06905 [Chitinophagaceae bacterium]